jgi:hypothetical protein
VREKTRAELIEKDVSRRKYLGYEWEWRERWRTAVIIRITCVQGIDIDVSLDAK